FRVAQRREDRIGARALPETVFVCAAGRSGRSATKHIQDQAHGSVPVTPAANAALTSRASLFGTADLSRSASRRAISGSVYAPARTRCQRPREPRSTSA